MGQGEREKQKESASWGGERRGGEEYQIIANQIPRRTAK